MRKLKLLLAACALLSAGQLYAQQTDVTATYLTNADFSTGTPIDNGICTYGKDMAGNNTTYYGAQEVSGWTNASVGATDSGYENSKLAGGIFAYGETPFLGGTGFTAPATAPEGSTGNTLGLLAVWGGSIQYTQNVTLPAGSYTLRFKVYNATPGEGKSSGVITTNLFGFVPNEGTAYYAPNNTFAIGQWVNVAVTFNLAAETAGKISMGYVGPNGGNDMPHLFVDNVKILKNTYFEDVTNKVNTQGWTGASDGYQGGSINTARQYGDKSIGRHIYQTVNGLKNGTYEVALYSISQKEWQGSLANDAGNVAYVFADDDAELKEWINARARNSYPGDANVGIYTISGVEVTDGKLTIGMGLAQADLTEWHHVQIKSLIYTKNLDLSGFIAAYNSALAAAKAVDQTKKMAASVKTALNKAIDDYDTGKVNTEDGDALQAATDALETATANANTSIASYAIIASGTVSTSSLDGWTCTNSNTFHINTWSTEGNSDGSGMTTPFIENHVGKGSSSNPVYLGAGTFSYTLEGLEPGEIYYAQALIRSYSELGNTPNGPNFFINDVETDLSTEGTECTAGAAKGKFATMGAVATVSADGKITLGAVIASDANYNWVAFKNVSIKSMDDAFNAAVAKVTALNGTIPTAAYDAAYAVVTANSGSNYPTTAAGFEAAIAAIEAAATTASAIVEPYSKANALIASATTLKNVDNDNITANDELGTAISNATSNLDGCETVAAIENVVGTLKGAMTTYVGVANPVGDGAQFDCTFMLSDNDLTGYATRQHLGSWFTDQTFSGQNSQTMTDNNSVANSSDNTKYAMYEYWSGSNEATSGFTVYQEYTLPVGTYRMDALCCVGYGYASDIPESDRNSNITFSAGDVDGTKITTATLEPATLDFVQTSEGKVKIGLKAQAGNTANWMGIGYVQLFKVPAAAPVELDETKEYDYTYEGAATAKLTREIYAGFNTVMLPFSLSASEMVTVFGEGTLYAFTDADAGSLNFSESTTLQANTPYLFKATAAKSLTAVEIAGRTFVPTSAAQVATAGTDYNFVGTYIPYAKDADANPIVIGKDYILGADNNFHKTTAKNALKAFRAYIQANNENDAARLAIVIDGETTAIEAIDGRVLNNAVLYNLAGQQVKKAQKGLYIQNGKKVVVK